ncbi:MAG TPA: nitroreductase/quinone reductase family protein [Anaerolineae bacterium]|nr:nitroreductase/quinone reductase family protein [Anaerolineae bacterium]HMR62381.1 nitroreductase/quinone reductase family protein [Anaerolineae bacterium]
MTQNCQTFEREFFRTINKYLEPLARAGLGSPGVVPIGAIVLETKGRKSGTLYRTPLIATEFIDVLLVSTGRKQSQWIRNLAATPRTHIWLRARYRPVMAYIVGPEITLDPLPGQPSPRAKLILEAARQLNRLTGNSYAVLDTRLEGENNGSKGEER